MSAPWVIVGCGYTGQRLARALLADGADVLVTRRDPAAAAALGAELGTRAVALDLADPASVRAFPPIEDAILVDSAPPAGDPAAEILSLCTLRPARIVYLSSTGVYGPAHGAWVDEDFPCSPHTEQGRSRAAAEAALAHAPVPHTCLRVAGIHGPGRGLLERIRAGAYRIVGDGTAHVSRIHVDDLVAAIRAAGTAPAAELPAAINVADDDPAPIGEVADAIAAHLGLPPPPRVAPSTVAPEIAGMLTADRRIANARLHALLRAPLRYPSWRSLLSST